MFPAALFMGIDDTYGLQVSVDHHATHEFHAFLAKIFGNGVRQRRGGKACLVKDVSSGKSPKVSAEGAIFLLRLKKHTGIGHGRLYLQAVADNARVSR